MHSVTATGFKLLMRKILFCFVANLLLFAGAAFAQEAPADSSQHFDLPTLKKELASVQADLATAQQNLGEKLKEMREKQHELEYQDSEIVAIREEMVALEKQVIAKREDLKTRLALKPAIKELESERKELFRSLQNLRNTEAAIQREIAILERSE